MLIIRILLTALIPLTTFGMSKDFRIVNDRLPHEFTLLFESLKAQVSSPHETRALVDLARELDENLGLLSKEHLYFLVKSEIIKNVLEHNHQKVRNFDVTVFLLERLQKDLNSKNQELNSFSLWIWRSILAELIHRKDMGLITERTFDPKRFKGNKQNSALRFKKYLKYLTPWVDKMDGLSAKEFNQYSTTVAWSILKKLNQRSLLFKRFASTATSSTRIAIFNIPTDLLENRDDKVSQPFKEEPTLTLKEESQKQKSQAIKEVQAASPDDLSPLSEEVSRELENKID